MMAMTHTRNRLCVSCKSAMILNHSRQLKTRQHIFKHGNGDRVETWENSNGTWSVRFLKGATLLVPKALRFDRYTATQIPTGWDPARYGIPQDIIDSVDRTTCYALVSAMEALVSSGITDPYELYQYFHVS
ncbi:hypothetical protein DL89DRAFT_57516 [Linderina pennispora]|uniref:Beta-ketoacyl synthase N-terminal domain-containing protein n=1 Tax=Linderina pennispora TaxID=61395 RepID=A0A1Y1VSM7_9FUNG|nr:uncharacterized protein DL89DRAFT_57516 [Linderina pennispora]ORX64016.1 hypothetical protein DL89DRAFT_57516 [Linderina pennispora]